MKLLFTSLANLWCNLKVAAKDRVDLIMFGIIAVLAYFDLFVDWLPGSVGFAAFYVFWLLIRLATLKREMKGKGMLK